MLDFNKKKRVLKNLNSKAESSFLLRLPCKIAAAFVKLFYFLAMSMDIALSDKNGKFLGIEEKAAGGSSAKRDEIVYVRRPIWRRVLSVVLTAAFVMTFIPAAEAYAVEPVYVLDSATGYYYDSTQTVGEPTIDASSCVTGNGAYRLTWNYSDANTTGFDVYYKPSTGSKVLAVELPNTSVQSYIMTGLTPSVNYIYSVSAFRKIPLYLKTDVANPDGSTSVSYIVTGQYYSIYSSESTISGYPNAVLTAPTISVAYTTQPGGTVKKPIITMSSPTAGADGYIVYRRNSDASSPTDSIISVIRAADVTSSTLYVDESSLSSTTLYSYVVSAYKDVFGRYGTSPYTQQNDAYYVKSPTLNNYHEILTDTSAPTNPKINTSSESSISLSWTKVNGATGYYIYRYTQAEVEAAGTAFAVDASHRIADITSGTAYVDGAIENKITYFYYISAYRTTNGGASNEGSVVGISGSISTTVTSPQSFLATPSDGQIRLTWTNTDTSAAGYEIDITQTTDSDGNPIANPTTTTVNVNALYYDHVGLYNGETYSYVIRSYKIINNIRYYSDDVGPRTVTVGSRFAAPQNVSVLLNTDGSATLSWSAVSGASGYYVDISQIDTYGNTTVLPERDVTGTSYIHSALTTDYTYRYYVTAYKFVNGKLVKSSPSETVSLRAGNYISAPTDIIATVKDGGVTLSWTAVKNVDGYTVYAQNTTLGTAIEIIDTSKASCQLPNLTNGTWAFYVSSYRTINGQRVTSNVSNTVNAYIGNTVPTPADVVATGTDGSITVKWTAVSGAEGYVVYETINGYTTQYNVSKPTYTKTGLAAGTVASYQIQAYKTINGTRVYSNMSTSITAMASSYIPVPADFTVTANETGAGLSWTAVKGVDGYTVYGAGAGRSMQIDVSKTSYAHSGLNSGDTWGYYVRAYKVVNGTRVYGNPTATLSVTIGVTLAAPTDLVAKAGDTVVDLTWTKVKNADGYVVYLYNSTTKQYDPITIVSATKYTHTGLTNGKTYTYMVVAYKTSNNERVYGSYSLAVSAVPSADGLGGSGSIDSILNVKGTAPYGISHSELISAAANHSAFDEPADAYFSTNSESTDAVKSILRKYAGGLDSFIVYPFDIELYKANSLVQIVPNDGYSVAFTMPIPDKLVPYRDFITVMHVTESGEETIYGDNTIDVAGNFEVLPSALVQIGDVWCIRFETTSCSPFAFVIYRDAITDIASGAATAAGSGSAAGSFSTQVLICTILPDILPAQKKYFFAAVRKIYKIKRNDR